MIRNPSEIMRLLEEAEHYREMSHDLTKPKSFRERALRNLREIERELDIDEEPSYNGDKS